LVAKGRDADVFAVGDDRVRRRFRNGRTGQVEREAAVMALARDAGVAVPEVFEASGADLVMARLSGPTMLDRLGRRPWLAGRFGRELAAWHAAVHEVRVPPSLGLAQVGEGDRLLHLDLHPGNVVFDDGGPMLIDFTNAAQGDPLLDEANTWALLATAEADDLPALVERVAGVVRRRLLGSFVKALADADATAARLPEACERRLADPNCRPAERLLLARLAMDPTGGVSRRKG
jgi:tRNA A-37 threonylcarbamoyl transferase component Bud32